MPQWTKTPPTEPGCYLVVFRGIPTVAEMEYDVAPDRMRREWYAPGRGPDGDEYFDWFWPEPIEFPPLPENTNTPDQAGA
jgi:hypothetical protein